MKKRFLVMAAVVLSLPFVALAEVPVLTPKQLQEDATHIVVGKVQKVYAITRRDKNWEATDYVAEIAIDKVEKGDGLAPGSLAYVRYWHKTWVGSGPQEPDASGHGGVMKGGSVRAYLAQDKKDKGLNVLLPNGFADLANDGK